MTINFVGRMNIMSADDNQLAVDVDLLEQGKEVVAVLAGLKPESSMSFSLDDAGLAALTEVFKVAGWGMGNNMRKLREAAVDILTPFVSEVAGIPLNANLTEYELKAMNEVITVVERAVKNQRDGIWKR